MSEVEEIKRLGRKCPVQFSSHQPLSAPTMTKIKVSLEELQRDKFGR